MQILSNVGPVTTFGGPVTFNYQINNGQNVGPCYATPQFPWTEAIDALFESVTTVSQAVQALSNADGTNHPTYYVTFTVDPGNTGICNIDIVAFGI